MNPIEVAQEIFFTENARMLMAVHSKGEANWKSVAKMLYAEPKNFDMFKALAWAEDLICQTDATKNAKTKAGNRKFMINSLADGAIYKCTELGNQVVDALSTCKCTLKFIDCMKKWKDRTHNGMSFYEFMLSCEIEEGANPFDPKYIEDNIVPELDTVLGSSIKAAFGRRMKKFFSDFSNDVQALDNVYNIICGPTPSKKPISPLRMKANLAKKLYWGDHLKFKRFIKNKCGFNHDFYFDYVYGVDGRTDKSIKGLMCNGTITWQEALNILKQHFNAA